jgi:hypothetical protein
LDGELRQLTPRSIAWRRDHLEKLQRFLHHRDYTLIGTNELKQYFLYLAKGHEEEEGRWDNAIESFALQWPMSLILTRPRANAKSFGT